MKKIRYRKKRWQSDSNRQRTNKQKNEKVLKPSEIFAVAGGFQVQCTKRIFFSGSKLTTVAHTHTYIHT